MAALTFDDGPDPRWTPAVLDELAALGARATFFVVAPRARACPEAIERAAAEGHGVELHCTRHVRHDRMTRAELAADTEMGLATLGEMGVTPTRWRPPWGVLSPDSRHVAGERGLELTGWTLDTEDWRGRDARHTLRELDLDAEPDPVVLMHDGIGPGARREGCRSTVELIEPLLAALGGPTSSRLLGAERVPVPWPR